MTNQIEAIRPYHCQGQLTFSEQQHAALNEHIAIAQKEAELLDAVKQLRERGWSFGTEGDLVVNNEFLPFVPSDDVATLPSEDRPTIECKLRLPRLNVEPVNTRLFAISMKGTRAVLSAYAELNNADRFGDRERSIAIIFDTLKRIQPVSALVMSSLFSELRDGEGYYAEGLLISELRAHNSKQLAIPAK